MTSLSFLFFFYCALHLFHRRSEHTKLLRQNFFFLCNRTKTNNGLLEKNADKKKKPRLFFSCVLLLRPSTSSHTHITDELWMIGEEAEKIFLAQYTSAPLFFFCCCTFFFTRKKKKFMINDGRVMCRTMPLCATE